MNGVRCIIVHSHLDGREERNSLSSNIVCLIGGDKYLEFGGVRRKIHFAPQLAPWSGGMMFHGTRQIRMYRVYPAGGEVQDPATLKG
jgi:hypothetical protein